MPTTAPTQQPNSQNTATNTSALLKQQTVNNQATMTDLDKIAAQIVGLKQKISSSPQLA
jgi:hypothetical protein